MIIRILFISLFCTSFLFAKSSAVFQKIEKEMDSIIVKDLSNDKLIFSKAQNKSVRPASLTKIMTTILAIESSKFHNIVTITKDMINVEPTIAGFEVGDRVFLRDLVYAALIKSANDAANAIAYYLGDGDKEKFVAMMNEKAKALGMNSTNFTNPSGFDIGKHYSTANDLLLLTEYAIKNQTFNNIVKLNKYTINMVNSHKKIALYTSNRLQKKDKYVVGIKTGYTKKAGACLIARAKKNDKDILLVMLNSNNRWAIAKNALEEATKNTPSSTKSNFSQKIAHQGKESLLSKGKS